MSKKNPKTMGYHYFAIVGHKDNLLFDLEFTTGKDVKVNDPKFMMHFMAHAGLDIVDRQKWRTTNMYLKAVDKFHNSFVSGFVTASLIRFVLVHENRNDEGIGNFFNDVYELYIKHSMNPFYEDNSTIKSMAFERKALMYAKKYLCF